MAGEGSQGWIWVNRWDEFQSFQRKRGKPWTPPWIKLHVRVLDEPAFLDLTPETRMLLVGLWALFARTRGTLTKDTRRLSRQLNQRVTERQLERLNHAGWIDICSGTVLEQRRNMFWNSSNLEVEEEENPPSPPNRGGSQSGSRRRTRGGTVPEPFSITKRWASYIDNVAYLQNADPLHNNLTLTDALEELAYWRTLPLATEDITDEDARAQWDEAHQSLADLPL